MKTSTTVKELNLSVRTINCLGCANIGTVGELIEFYDDFGINGFLKLRNFGRKCAKEIEDLLININIEDEPAEEQAQKPIAEPDEFHELCKNITNDIHTVLSIIGETAEHYNGEQGIRAFFCGMANNFLSLLFGCKITDGTNNDRIEQAKIWFDSLVDTVDPTDFDIPKVEI